MNTINAILTAAKDTHKLPILRIVETGNENTLGIAQFVSNLSQNKATFDTVDLDSNKQESVHKTLEQHEVAKFCTFHTQSHKKFLNDLNWVDVAFLHPENLQEGLEEFQLAASAGARIIVMMDYQTRAAGAIKQAERFGWHCITAGIYNILTRPQPGPDSKQELK